MVRKIILWMLVIGCMVMIFSFSAQEADESRSLSDGILIDILDFLNIQLPVGVVEFLSFLIRKAAHFSIYALLGISVYLLVRSGYGKSGKMSVCVSLVTCLVYASGDELHQVFVPGRSGQISDVLLDFCGAMTGVFVIGIIYFLKRGRKND